MASAGRPVMSNAPDAMSHVAGPPTLSYAQGVSNEPDDLGNWFQPVSEALMADRVAGPVLRKLAQDDPDLIAAVADVDRSQVRDMLALSPEQRLAHASRIARALEGYRRVGG